MYSFIHSSIEIHGVRILRHNKLYKIYLLSTEFEVSVALPCRMSLADTKIGHTRHAIVPINPT
jgi:hypothetical protein